MDVIGLICEYNPFHNGHLYHIKKIKEMYPDSILILVLNGYFLERGEFSILTKEEKTKLALKYGIDIVLELPVIFGTQSADTFANISLKILNNFQVNKLVFGSESNDIKTLINISKKEMDDEFNSNVKKYMKNGENYPTALYKSLNLSYPLNSNDLLAISYIKAILNNNYSIEPITIKRTNNYNDLTSNDYIISASNIRNKLDKEIDIAKYIPTTEEIIRINKQKYFEILKYKIITDTHLDCYLDVQEGLDKRLKKVINNVHSIEELLDKLKTKRYTYNKLNRMLVHIFLGIKKDITKELEYIKILGFSNKGSNYLNKIKNGFLISTSVNTNTIQFQYELKASILYDLINNTNTYQFEIRNLPIKIDKATF